MVLCFCHFLGYNFSDFGPAFLKRCLMTDELSRTRDGGAKKDGKSGSGEGLRIFFYHLQDTWWEPL